MSTDAADGPADVEVVVGRIGKPHGLRGEVTVDVRTDEPERRFASARELAALIPDSRLVPLESRNHIMTSVEPAWQEFLDEVDRFLATS